MNNRRAKILRHTARLLFSNKGYMAKFPKGFTEKALYKLMKADYKE